MTSVINSWHPGLTYDNQDGGPQDENLNYSRDYFPFWVPRDPRPHKPSTHKAHESAGAPDADVIRQEVRTAEERVEATQKVDCEPDGMAPLHFQVHADPQLQAYVHEKMNPPCMQHNRHKQAMPLVLLKNCPCVLGAQVNQRLRTWTQEQSCLFVNAVAKNPNTDDK